LAELLEELLEEFVIVKDFLEEFLVEVLEELLEVIVIVKDFLEGLLVEVLEELLEEIWEKFEEQKVEVKVTHELMTKERSFVEEKDEGLYQVLDF
jgi:F0F1-type ATP synthase delta subunit